MLHPRMEVLTMKFEQIKSSSNWQLQQQEQQYQLEKKTWFWIFVWGCTYQSAGVLFPLSPVSSFQFPVDSFWLIRAMWKLEN